MRAVFALLFVVFALVAVAPGCGAPAEISCPTNLDSLVAAFTAPKVPLNTQSVCAGYTSAPFQGQSFPGTPPPICYVQPSDSPCDACLGGQCCAEVNQACRAGGEAAPLSVCTADPGVKSCFVSALAGICVTECGSGGVP